MEGMRIWIYVEEKEKSEVWNDKSKGHRGKEGEGGLKGGRMRT